MKTFRNKMAGFTLVEIMTVVMLIGILLAIAIPDFITAREWGRARACVANLKQIDSAKQQSAMDNNVPGTDTTTRFVIDGTTGDSATAHQLVGTDFYMKAVPTCPSNGLYSVGSVGATPRCSISTNATGGSGYAGPQSSTPLPTPEKWYHGF